MGRPSVATLAALLIAAVALVFVIWPAVADAPWENSEPSCPAALAARDGAYFALETAYTLPALYTPGTDALRTQVSQYNARESERNRLKAEITRGEEDIKRYC